MTDPSPWSRPGSEDGPPVEPAPTPAEIPAGTRAGEPTLEARLAEAQSARAGMAPLHAIDSQSSGPARESPAGAASGSSNAFLIPVVGIMLLVIGAVVVGVIAYLDRDDDNRYPANRGDDEYDLAPMALRQIDVPRGLVLSARLTFDNDEWSQLVSADDPELKKQQLDSQKRIRNELAFFSWPNDTTTEHLGQTLSVTSQSTLFETASAAEAETNRLCGLLINEADPLTEFPVPKLADQSVGFIVASNQEGIGKSYEAAVCFRTGRIVHGVVQSGLEGSEDLGLVVRLAQRMLAHVNETFDGKPQPLDPDPEQG